MRWIWDSPNAAGRETQVSGVELSHTRQVDRAAVTLHEVPGFLHKGRGIAQEARY